MQDPRELRIDKLVDCGAAASDATRGVGSNDQEAPLTCGQTAYLQQEEIACVNT
jgi:hypothetical protein